MPEETDVWGGIKETYSRCQSGFDPQEDLIGVYDNALPDRLCDEIIAKFENAIDRGQALEGHAGGVVRHSVKKSTDLPVTPEYVSAHAKDGWPMIVNAINEHLFQCVMAYCRKYFMLLPQVYQAKDGRQVLLPDLLASDDLMKAALAEMFFVRAFNIQRYLPPTEGYYAWHFEQHPGVLRRVLFHIIYLNDVTSGGETEFYFSKHKVAPVKGRVVLAPGGFSHTHRMSMEPLSNTKYIITSWVEYK